MNKVIQITSCGHDRNEYTQSNQTLFALDSDGNIYKMSNEDHEWDTIKSPITTSNSEYKTPSAQCSHFFRGTDGVHACIVEQCNHPDKEKW